MNKLIFTGTIESPDRVKLTGYVRPPTSLRFYIYDNGEVSIHTKGKISNYDDLPESEREAAIKKLVEYLSKLAT